MRRVLLSHLTQMCFFFNVLVVRPCTLVWRFVLFILCFPSILDFSVSLGLFSLFLNFSLLSCFVVTCPTITRVCTVRREQKRAVAGGTGAEGRADHAARQEYDGESGVEHQQGATDQPTNPSINPPINPSDN